MYNSDEWLGPASNLLSCVDNSIMRLDREGNFISVSRDSASSFKLVVDASWWWQLRTLEPFSASVRWQTLNRVSLAVKSYCADLRRYYTFLCSKHANRIVAQVFEVA